MFGLLPLLVSKESVYQLSVIMSIHGGLSLLKRFKRATFHGRLKHHPQITTKVPVVATLLSELIHMNVPQTHVDNMIALVDQMAHQCDDKDNPVAQWQISRSIQLILNEAHVMYGVMKQDTDADFCKKVIVHEDMIPRLTSALDDVLHNYLLARLG